MKFNVGQYVVYRSNGVCRVEAIGKLQFLQNGNGDYYTLRSPFASGDGCSYIPTEKESCLRAVITPDEARGYLGELAEMPAEPCGEKKHQLLVSHYQKLLSSSDLSEHLRLFKEVNLKDRVEKKKGKRLSATDEQYKRKVEQLLSEEFAVALNETPAASKERLYAALEH